MVIGLVHFRAVDIRYFEAALYSILWQRGLKGGDGDTLEALVILDNDTGTDPTELDDKLAFARDVLHPADVHVFHETHGDPRKRCQSWSVNRLFARIDGMARCGAVAHDPLVLFTRTDYILDKTLVAKFLHEERFRAQPFITSYAYHMAYDERGDQRVEGMRDIEPTRWRIEGAQVLLDRVNGWKVDSSHIDAGVWMTNLSTWRNAGGLREDLVSWGYQQTEFQWRLKKAGVNIYQIPEYLFFHQHHGGDFRSYDVAQQELEAALSGDELQEFLKFRDTTKMTGAVCDELDKPPSGVIQ